MNDLLLATSESSSRVELCRPQSTADTECSLPRQA